MSKIIEISEFFGERLAPEDDWYKHDGWRVTADDQTVTVGISNYQNCCERWGYLNSDDDPGKYVGAELLRVERVGEYETVALVTSMPGIPEYGLDDGAAIFVRIVTDRGTFTLAVYNGHNGYYGHYAVVISRELNISETL